MQLDDMILVSIDDDREPPDMFRNHVLQQVAGPDAPGGHRGGRRPVGFSARPRRRRVGMAPRGLDPGGLGLQPRLVRRAAPPAASTCTNG